MTLTTLPATPCTTHPDVYADPTQQRFARLLCTTRCPRLAACQQETLAAEQNGLPITGVAGGLLPTERQTGPARAERVDEARCGTESGYRRHKRLGHPKCEECWQARLEAERGRTARRRAGIPPVVGRPVVRPTGRTRPLDEVAVAAVADDHLRKHLPPAERYAVIDRLTRRGYSARQIAELLCTTQRSVTRGRHHDNNRTEVA